MKRHTINRIRYYADMLLLKSKLYYDETNYHIDYWENQSSN